MTRNEATKQTNAANPQGGQGALAAACALICLAGYVDALAILHSPDLLPVYVTGDTTKLASALTAGTWTRAWPPAAVILAFLCSSILAAWLGRVSTRPRPAPVLLLVGGFLLLGLLLGLREEGHWTLAVLLSVAAAMGAVNQVLANDPGVTFITGSLVRTARALSTGQVLRSGKDLLRWVAFLAGATGGALLNGLIGHYALAVPAAAALLAGTVLALRPSTSSDEES